MLVQTSFTFISQVMNDLHLRNWTADQRATGYDQELLAQYQSQFFSIETAAAEPEGRVPAGKKKKRKPVNKKTKCPLAVTGQRHSAQYHIRALDRMLLFTISVGLSAFIGPPRKSGDKGSNAIVGCEEEAKDVLTTKKFKPTLVLTGDEGSPGYCMNWFLNYWQGVRLLPVRDWFHRRWNDCKLSVSDAGLWFVVQLATIPFNLNFGPWEGCAWFARTKVMSEELIQSLTPDNPLYSALYELMCQDLQIPPEGTANHKRIVFEMAFSGSTFKTKGTKVSLNRWFAWLEAAAFFVQTWHVKLMSMLCIGQSLGVFTSWRDFPLWSHLPGKPAQETKEEEDHAVSEAQAVEEAAAAAAAVADINESNQKAQEEKATVKDGLHGSEEIKQLRKSCRNTRFVALNIMCKDGMQLLVLLILE